MDLLEECNQMWIDITCSFLMLSFLVFIGCLLWQHLKNKKEQEAIISQYRKNLEILENLKNRF